MRVPFALTSLLLVFTLVLAGCSGQADRTCTVGTGTATGGACSQLDQAVSQVHVQATATTGVIRGIVVDSGIRPIAGALVKLQTPDSALTTNTTNSGAFGFQGLKPGTYLIRVHKAGFLDAQAGTDVKAGDSSPPIVKLLLSPDSTFKTPYATVNHFKGFIECSVTTSVVAYTLCSTFNGWFPCSTVGLPDATCLHNFGNSTNDSFGTYIAVDSQPTWVQQVVVWTQTQPTNPHFLFVAGADSKADWYYAQASVKEMNRSIGPSPLVTNSNSTQIAKVGLGNGTIGLTPLVFTGGTPGTAPCVPDQSPVRPGFCTFQTGVSFEQEYDIYSIIFYGFLPPPGYSFVTDGEPTPPV
jgi:hypothetical protein